MRRSRMLFLAGCNSRELGPRLSSNTNCFTPTEFGIFSARSAASNRRGLKHGLVVLAFGFHGKGNKT